MRDCDSFSCVNHLHVLYVCLHTWKRVAHAIVSIACANVCVVCVVCILYRIEIMSAFVSPCVCVCVSLETTTLMAVLHTSCECCECAECERKERTHTHTTIGGSCFSGIVLSSAFTSFDRRRARNRSGRTYSHLFMYVLLLAGVSIPCSTLDSVHGTTSLVVFRLEKCSYLFGYLAKTATHAHSERARHIHLHIHRIYSYAGRPHHQYQIVYARSLASSFLSFSLFGDGGGGS